jgi:multidrug resistance efflux pump
MTDTPQQDSGPPSGGGTPAPLAGQEPPAAPPAAPEAAASKRLAVRIALGIVLLLVVVVAWNVASDRLAPFTSRGTVSAYVVGIAPRVSGRVTEIYIVDNQIVEAGEPLFAVERRPFELAVQMAEADLARATQSINASSAGLVASQAKVAQARSNLESVQVASHRTRTLADRGVLPRARAEDAVANLKSAQSAVVAAEAELRSAETQLGDAGRDNPQILGARLKLEQAQYDLLSTRVVAPRRGVVTNLSLAVGEYAKAGSPVLSFIDGAGAWVTADLRENQLVKADAGDPVDILFDGQPGHIYSGRLQSIAWGINPGRTTVNGLIQNQPETRWFEPARRMPVNIELDGGIDAWPANVRAGSKVNVVVYTDGRGGLVGWTAAGLLRLRSLISFLY